MKLALLDVMAALVEVEASVPEAFRNALGLVRRHQLSAYDAAYLDLALRRRPPLATLDRALRAAAAREGVAVLPAEAAPA